MVLREKFTGKHNARDLPYGLFVQARFLTALQTSQTIGCHRMGKPLARLMVALGSQM